MVPPTRAEASEMCTALYWAATNGVRVVNTSWARVDSDALNAAGTFLRINAPGILAMPGLNGPGFVDSPEQPDVWCISMADAADNQQLAYGYHIDFAAPGWQVYSTSHVIQPGPDQGGPLPAPPG